MQVFYISNHKINSETLSGLKKNYKEYESGFSCGTFSMKVFYKGVHLSLYSCSADFIANTGVFIYEDRFNKDGLKKFYEDLNSGAPLKDLLLKAHGQFSLVLYFGGELMVITDRFRTIPVYIIESAGIIEVTNASSLLAKNKTINYTVNFDYIAQHFSWDNGHCQISSDTNFYKEIKLLKPGSIYHLAGGTPKIETYYDLKKDIEFGKYKDLNQVVSKLAEVTERNYRFLDNVEKVFCGITGGFDTRLNLGTLIGKKKRFTCGSEIMEYDHCLKIGRFSDTSILNKIMDTFKLNYRNIAADTKSVMEWREANTEIFGIATSYIGSFHRYYYYNEVAKSFDIELSGFSGSELTTKDYHGYFRKKRRFDAREFAKTQNYNDIFPDTSYTKENFLGSLESYLNEIASGISYETRGELLTYLIYICYFMNDINNYWGAINMLCPAYSPYLEPDVIKLMMETPYEVKGFHRIQRHLYAKVMDKRLRDIDTTHGYPPTVITASNFLRFIRIVNPIDPNLQYYPVLRQMKKSVFEFMVARVLPALHRYLGSTRLKDKLPKGSVETYMNLISDSNPLNAYIDRKKLLRAKMNILLRGRIKSAAERMAVYLKK